MKQELSKYNKIIIGIDPGTNLMGHAVIGIINNRPEVIETDSANLKNKGDHYLKLNEIYDTVLKLLDNYLPDEMAIEAPFYGKNIQSMLKLGRAQGVAMAAALSRQIPICEYEPRKVKLSITGNGGASKEQVREMLIRILNIDRDSLGPHLDSSDALAIALCHFYESTKKISESSSKSWKEFITLHPERIKSK